MGLYVVLSFGCNIRRGGEQKSNTKSIMAKLWRRTRCFLSRISKHWILELPTQDRRITCFMSLSNPWQVLASRQQDGFKISSYSSLVRTPVREAIEYRAGQPTSWFGGQLISTVFFVCLILCTTLPAVREHNVSSFHSTSRNEPVFLPELRQNMISRLIITHDSYCMNELILDDKWMNINNLYRCTRIQE